jgi:hypothetical protein
MDTDKEKLAQNEPSQNANIRHDEKLRKLYMCYNTKIDVVPSN